VTRLPTKRVMSEADWQLRITDLCDLLDLKWHHETDSRKSKSGFPDLVICGPRGVIFAELKSEQGKVTKAQQEWVDALRASGATAYVWRPSGWPMVYYTLHDLADRHALPLPG
jgi:hypothetical protein